jgi:hypothetical protein
LLAGRADELCIATEVVVGAAMCAEWSSTITDRWHAAERVPSAASAANMRIGDITPPRS